MHFFSFLQKADLCPWREDIRCWKMGLWSSTKWPERTRDCIVALLLIGKAIPLRNQANWKSSVSFSPRTFLRESQQCNDINNHLFAVLGAKKKLSSTWPIFRAYYGPEYIVWHFFPRKFQTDQSALEFLFLFWFELRFWRKSWSSKWIFVNFCHSE